MTKKNDPMKGILEMVSELQQESIRLVTKQMIEATKQWESPLEAITKQMIEATKQWESPLEAITKQMIEATKQWESPLEAAKATTKKKKVETD